MARKARNIVFRLLTVGIFFLGLVGIVLRFTIRDGGSVALGGLFFGLPLPVCAALFCGGAILSGFLRERLWMRTHLAACLLTGIAWMGFSFKWQGADSRIREGNELRVGFWNMADNSSAFTRAGELIDLHSLDIMGLAELEDGKLGQDRERFLKSRTDWQLIHSGSLGLAARGNIAPKSVERLPNKSILHIYEVHLANQDPITVAIVDLGPDPLYRRSPNVSHVLSRLGPNLNNTVIMGDFNTPYESVAFDFFRENFHHSFTEAGRGFRETWPWPLPALSLDHIWVTRDWRPRICRKVNRWASDHAMIWAVLVREREKID